MTYALTLDNSWAVMSEEEMHDVNGGVSFGTWRRWFGFGWYIEVTQQEAADVANITFLIGAGGLAFKPLFLVVAATGSLSAHFWHLSNGNGGRLYFNSLFSSVIVWNRKRF